jgi:RNA polymerase sigma-70 factor, ECF subfamily
MGRVDEDATATAAALRGEETAFDRLVGRYQPELRAHCYRLLGSVDEAEDLVQETFLRAWKGRAAFRGDASPRTWLYRIATNACLDHLARAERRVLPSDLLTAGEPGAVPTARSDVAWLQPYPDRLLPAGSCGPEPDAAAIDRETIELAFIAALQHLPASQRAVLILRDVAGWPAKDTAGLLGVSVASANSALLRARKALKERMPGRRTDWAAAGLSDHERAILRRYMDAVEGADLSGVAALLAQDVRATMPPYPLWFQGRESVLSALALGWNPASPGYVGRLRLAPAGANRQPAVAAYRCPPGDRVYRAEAIGLLRVEGGHIAELTAFHDPGLFTAFGLPPVWPAEPGRPAWVSRAHFPPPVSSAFA